MPGTNAISRRAFAASAAALAVSGATAAEQEKDDPLAEQVDALLALVKAKHGKHLDKDDLDKLAGKLRGNLVAAQRMNAVKLANGDEPDLVVTADVP